MDEVFDSSLDGFGTEEFLKIIRYVVKDANIFIISHKTELHERFDSVLRFEKEGILQTDHLSKCPLPPYRGFFVGMIYPYKARNP